MNIAIVTVQVPFVRGGAEVLQNMLKDELIKRGHNAEIVSIPFKFAPLNSVADCMMMGRMMDLSGMGIDLVIAMRFPAYYVKHDHKIIWLMHQHRAAYDLWETEYSDMHTTNQGIKMRDFIVSCDKKYLGEVEKIYTISQTTTDRLKKFCNIESKVLYHPPLNFEALTCESYGDFVFYPSRITQIKRQRLLVEAAKYVKTDVKIVVAGTGSQDECEYLHDIIKANHLQEKVKMVGYITEEEKINYYANCLGVYFGAHDEDYGYITLESFYSQKSIIVHTDAGGPLEFVKNNINGFVVKDDARAIAEKLDFWYENKDVATEQGKKGYQSMLEKHMDWDRVIETLLS